MKNVKNFNEFVNEGFSLGLTLLATYFLYKFIKGFIKDRLQRKYDTAMERFLNYLKSTKNTMKITESDDDIMLRSDKYNITIHKGWRRMDIKETGGFSDFIIEDIKLSPDEYEYLVDLIHSKSEKTEKSENFMQGLKNKFNSK